MGGFSLYHWLIVLLIVALIFGTKRLRNIGADLGSALRDFRKGLSEGSDNTTSQPQLKADPAPESVTPAASENKRDNVQ